MGNPKIDVSEQVKSLVQKAAAAATCGEALQWSQAASNAAHAMSAVNSIAYSATAWPPKEMKE
jgi:hypothetical protein